MNSNLKRSKHFLLLLLDTSKTQARALLETAKPSQVIALSEVALNLHQNPVLQTKFKKQSKRHQSIIRRIGDRDLKETLKYQLICKHWKVVWELVLLVKIQLKQLLI